MAPRRRPPRLRHRRDAEKIAAIHPKAPQETRNNPTLSAQTAPQRRSHSTQNSSDHRQPIKISSPFEKCGLGGRRNTQASHGGAAFPSQIQIHPNLPKSSKAGAKKIKEKALDFLGFPCPNRAFP